MPAKLSLEGLKFGKLTVIMEVYVYHETRSHWLVQCDCGTIYVTVGKRLTHKTHGIKSCGCSSKDTYDLVGHKFFEYTVVEKLADYPSKYKAVYWKCQCSCGAFKVYSTATIKSNKVKSCGCKTRYYSQLSMPDMSGVNHWRYDPSMSHKERVDRRKLYGFIQWRKAVFSKDKYTCVLCQDASGGNLEAHHLLGWDNFEEARFLVINGATLCNKCHKLFHTNYGYGGNTYLQWLEFCDTFNEVKVEHSTFKQEDK